MAIAALGLIVTPLAGSAVSDRFVLWSARTAGARPIPLRVLPADLPGDVAQDPAIAVLDRTTAGRLAVAERDDVVIENLDGTGRVVLPIAGVYDGRFSPDGSQLALARLACPTGGHGCPTLTIVDSDGGNARTQPAGSARWLSDRTLTYVRDVTAGGVGALVLADPRGRVIRILGRSYAFPSVTPAPSPDGRAVADQCKAQVICVRTTGSPVRVVARFRGALAGPPLWSPDGRRIALTLAGNYTSKTAVGTVESARLDPISSPASIHIDDAIVGWSPDSSTILVQRRCLGASPCSDQVFSDVLATRARRRLTHDDRKWESVRWTKASLTFVTPPRG